MFPTRRSSSALIGSSSQPPNTRFLRQVHALVHAASVIGALTFCGTSLHATADADVYLIPPKARIGTEIPAIDLE
jgi:hypothetical protein